MSLTARSELIFHIGMLTTGTTSIQEAFRHLFLGPPRSLWVLRDLPQAAAYADSQHELVRRLSATLMMQARHNRLPDIEVDGASQTVDSVLRAGGPETIVISEERLWMAPQLAGALAHRARARGRRPTALTYVRPMASYIESALSRGIWQSQRIAPVIRDLLVSFNGSSPRFLGEASRWLARRADEPWRIPW